MVTQNGRGFRASSSEEGSIAASGSKCDIIFPENLVNKNHGAHLIFLTSDDENNVSASQFTCRQMVLSGCI